MLTYSRVRCAFEPVFALHRGEPRRGRARYTLGVFKRALLLLIVTGIASAAPPASERGEYSYTLGGRTVEDPFLWLEGSAAPELASADTDALDARVRAWTEAQNAYTREVLDALPGRDAVAAELRELLSLDSYGIPRMAGDWLFYSLRRGGQAQPVLYAQQGASGEPRVLLDVNALDPDGLLALDWYRPSPDGRRVAFGVYRAGDENTTAHVLETATGDWLDDEIPGRVDPVEWLDDGERFVVRRLSDAANPYSGQILVHELGRAVGRFLRRVFSFAFRGRPCVLFPLVEAAVLRRGFLRTVIRVSPAASATTGDPEPGRPQVSSGR